MVPNIFRYATKELSQDALICWLVACAKEAEGELRECGLAFVEALLRSGSGRVIDARKVAEEGYQGEGHATTVERGPCPQHGGIDVYFQAKVDGNLVSFVVEDKTGTEMHGGQLERYRQAVGEDHVAEDLIKAVYFKTGYVFGDERQLAERAGYCVFEAEDVVGFFEKGARTALHAFVHDFAEYVGGLVESRRQARSQWNLDEGFVQWEFMVALSQALNGSDANWPAKDFNIGGSAWTQYPHYDRRGNVFWRLDSWKPLRLMVDTNAAANMRSQRGTAGLARSWKPRSAAAWSRPRFGGSEAGTARPSARGRSARWTRGAACSARDSTSACRGWPS